MGTGKEKQIEDKFVLDCHKMGGGGVGGKIVLHRQEQSQ